MDWMQVARDIEPFLHQGDIDYCINHVSNIIRSLPQSPYHHVLEVDFTNDPAEIAAEFDRFATERQDKIEFKAIYTATNGFFINFDLWYFEIGGHPVSSTNDTSLSCYDKKITLTGMESLQDIYQRIWDSKVYDILSYGGDPEVEQLRIINDFCDLLVVLHFQNLIRRSTPFMQTVKVPIFATAHEYDFIYSINPAGLKP